MCVGLARGRIPGRRVQDDHPLPGSQRKRRSFFSGLKTGSDCGSCRDIAAQSASARPGAVFVPRPGQSHAPSLETFAVLGTLQSGSGRAAGPNPYRDPAEGLSDDSRNRRTHSHAVHAGDLTIPSIGGFRNPAAQTCPDGYPGWPSVHLPRSAFVETQSAGGFPLRFPQIIAEQATGPGTPLFGILRHGPAYSTKAPDCRRSYLAYRR